MSPPPRARSLAGDPAQLLGQTLGSHRLIRLLGHGGMGAVYEAEHVKIGRRDAVKVLFPELAAGEYAERFLREAQAVNRVQHPCLVQIHHFDQTADGLLYIVMELLHGVSVEARLAASPQGLPRPLALAIARDVASAMAAVHAVGIVHRDLTPRNIMLVKPPGGGAEQVKVLDFGIAKVPTRSRDGEPGTSDPTSGGSIVGSRDYMAPEQFTDLDAVTDRGDVFSLGILLCELLSGRRPFPGFSIRLLTLDPPPLNLPTNIPPTLHNLLTRMLAKDASMRVGMGEVEGVLAGVLAGRRRRVGVAVVAAAVAVLGGAVWLGVSRQRGGLPSELAVATLRSQAQAILRAAATDGDAQRRSQAAVDIGRSQQPALGPTLVALLGDPQPAVRVEAIRAVADWEYVAARPALAPLKLAASDELQSVEAIFASARLGDPQGRGELTQLSASLPERRRLLASQRLCELGDSDGCGQLRSGLAGPGLRLPAGLALPAYWALARSGDPLAQDWLHQQSQQTAQPALRLHATALLAQLPAAGSDGQAQATAQKLIVRLAQEGDFLAATEAAHLRSGAGQDTLLRWLGDPEKRLESRILAARALGEAASGLERSLRALAPLLRAGASQELPAELRVAAAGSMLRLLLSERDLDGWELAMVSGTMSSSGLLAWLDDGQKLPPGDEVAIFKQLGEKERRLLALLAGRQPDGHTIGLLSAALADGNSGVELAGLAALATVLHDLEQPSQRSSPGLLALLQRLASRGSAVDRVVAAAVQLRLGDPQAAELLQRLLGSSMDSRLRELIVELAPARLPSPLLQAALADRELAVRFLAARSLARLGSAAGLTVLEEVRRLGGAGALAADGWLRRLGQKLAPLDGLRLLADEPDLRRRYQALEALPELDLEQALPLLEQALTDPAVAVRTRVAELLAQLYRRSPKPALLGLLRSLLSDEDPLLRTRVLELLRELRRQGLTEPGGPAASPIQSPLWQPRPEVAATVARAAQPTAAANPPVPARPGRPLPSPSVVQPPLGAAQRLSKSALAAEGRGDFLQAMNSWEALLRLPTDQRSPAMEAEARQALGRVQRELGSFRLFHLVDGKCTAETQVRWGKPGDNLIAEYKLRVFLHKGQYKDVRTLCTP